MSLNHRIEKILKVKNNLDSKLIREGLTKKEKNLLDKINVLTEDAMSFDPESIGGARPSRTLQSKIEKGELPLSKFGLTQAQVDFFTSQAFKSSVNRLEELLGRSSGISRSLTLANRNLKTDARTAFNTFMGVVGELMSELVSLQMSNKEELEQIAVESVEKVMGIDREFFDKKIKLDGQFTMGFLSKLKGMKNKIEKISDDEIAKKFADIDAEKKQKIEDLKKDIESAGVEPDEEKVKQAVESTFQISPQTLEKAKKEFSDEVSRRMIINMFRRGMSLYYASAYDICEDKIRQLPDGDRIIELSNVIQPIMLHMYWLFDDIGGIGSSGGGHIGQVQVKPPQPQGSEKSGSDDEDEEQEKPKRPEPPKQQSKKQSGPFIIQARAGTLPLLVHELVKGVIMFFTSLDNKGTPEQRQLVNQASSSLETEAYDLVYSEPFFLEFYKIYKEIMTEEVKTYFKSKNMEVDEKQIENEVINRQRGLTTFLLKLLSGENIEVLVRLTKSLTTSGLEEPGFADLYIRGLVERSKKLRNKMEQNPSYMKVKEYPSTTTTTTVKPETEDGGWDFDLDI